MVQKFILGLVVGIVLLPAAAFLYVWFGFAPVATSASPLPFERTIAGMALDARVHRFVYRCAGNSYLEATLGRYLNLSLRIWHLVIDRLPHLFARVHEHDDLLRAIADGEGERAREILAEHIATFEREIRTVL